MADDDRLEWFPCEPAALLGALGGMPPPKKLVYVIVLLRIYEAGGACPDTIAALTMRTGHNKRVVSEALNELFQEGRLYQGEGGIRNRKADEVIAESLALREKRQIASQKAGLASAEKRQTKQGKPPTTGSTSAAQPSTPLPLQDSLFSNENRASESKSAKPSAAMPNPPPDAEADYYRRGREVLGPTAGGVLTNLLRVKGGNLALARAAIEQASTRGDAKQYVGAMLRNGGTGNGQRVGGFAGITAGIRARRAASDGTPADTRDAGELHTAGGSSDSRDAMGAPRGRQTPLLAAPPGRERARDS